MNINWFRPKGFLKGTSCPFRHYSRMRKVLSFFNYEDGGVLLSLEVVRLVKKMWAFLNGTMPRFSP